MTANESQSSRNSAPARKVRKAVLPAAGLGTRFLPATKAQPKEMLAVVDKPQIQYVAEECVASGIEHIIIVTGRGRIPSKTTSIRPLRSNVSWKKEAGKTNWKWYARSAIWCR